MEIIVSEPHSLYGDRQLVSYPNSDSDERSCNSKQQPILLDEDFDEHCEKYRNFN